MKKRRQKKKVNQKAKRLDIVELVCKLVDEIDIDEIDIDKIIVELVCKLVNEIGISKIDIDNLVGVLVCKLINKIDIGELDIDKIIVELICKSQAIYINEFVNKLVVELVKKSTTDDLEELKKATNINCYAFARHFILKDKNKKIYTPGMFSRLKKGSGNFILKGTDLDLEKISKCIHLDSTVLNQKVTQVTFDSISKDDDHFYFAIALYRICPERINPIFSAEDASKFYLKTFWHFIMRTPEGKWLHKPNWIQPVEEIEWNESGKTFYFQNNLLPVIGECFNNYFYRLDKK